VIAILLHLFLAAFGLAVIVAPLAAYGLRELAPASQARRTFAPAGGGWA
jgi:hypothetical protein